jgi:Xaa-Pro aminopeptidase
VQSQTNVVSGPKLNRLHDAATGRAAGPGEMVFVMGGASVNGYWANIGRTLFVPGGPPPRDARQGLDVADAAQRAGVGRLGPGIPLGEAVRAADAVLAAAGLADRKTYPVFRGLGLRIDERPRAADLHLILKPGMCLCAQLYLRLPEFIVGRSDSVLITEEGAVVVSDPRGEA